MLAAAETDPSTVGRGQWRGAERMLCLSAISRGRCPRSDRLDSSRGDTSIVSETNRQVAANWAGL